MPAALADPLNSNVNTESTKRRFLVKKKFSVGDIVKLKSGGPDMTVQTTPNTNNPNYRCQWFAGKKLEAGLFPEDSLELAKGSE